MTRRSEMRRMTAQPAPLQVLVVDDEPAIRRFLRTSLDGAGLSA